MTAEVANTNIVSQRLKMGEYAAALKINPKDDDIYCYRGWLHGRMGEDEKALADFTKAVELAPDNLYAHNGKAVGHYVLHEYKKSLQEFNFLLEDNYFLTGLFCPRLHNLYKGRALVYLELNKPAEALADFQKAISLLDAKTQASEIEKCREKIAEIETVSNTFEGEA